MSSTSKVLSIIFRRALELPRSFKIALASVFLIILLVLIFPFQLIVVPEWSLRVLDNSAQGVSGVNVTEHWQHYLLELQGHEDLKRTGSDGAVHFPKRTIRASLLRRFFSRLGKVTAHGQSARIDRYASIVIWGNKIYEIKTFVWTPDGPLPEQIVLQTK